MLQDASSVGLEGEQVKTGMTGELILAQGILGQGSTCT